MVSMDELLGLRHHIIVYEHPVSCSVTANDPTGFVFLNRGKELMYLLCIYLDRLESKELLQPRLKKKILIYSSMICIWYTIDGIFMTIVVMLSLSLNFSLNT